MNPRTVLSIAAAALDVLPLAEKTAESNWHWRQINRQASDLLTVLRSIEQDDVLIEPLRRAAAKYAEDLRSIQRRSCERVEETQNQPIAS